MQRTIIVIPCYNEGQRLDQEHVIGFVRSALDVDLLFVNDGSTDDTLNVLNSLRDFDRKRIRVHTLSRNVGKAEAVRQGILLALSETPGFIGYWDADFAAPLDEVRTFQEIFADRPQTELVLGSRLQILGRTIKRSTMRHYLGRVFATAVSLMLKMPVYDSQCGAKLFQVTPHLGTLFNEPFYSRWFFDVEILARRKQLTHKIPGLPKPEEVMYEAPLSEWVHVRGSKVGFSVYLGAAFDLVRILVGYRLYRI